jgi:hypothetical protein
MRRWQELSRSEEGGGVRAPKTVESNSIMYYTMMGKEVRTVDKKIDR